MKQMMMAALLALGGTAHAQAAMSAEGDASIRDLRAFAVIDAKGNFVGRLYAPYVVQMVVGDKRYLLPLTSVSKGTTTSLVSMTYLEPNYLYYTSTDCTGPALVLFQAYGEPEAGAPSAITTIDPSTGQVELYPTKGEVEVSTANSVRYLPTSGQCQHTEDAGNFVPLLDPIDITALYALPFRVK